MTRTVIRRHFQIPWGTRRRVKTYFLATIFCLSAVPAFGSPIFVPTFTAAFNSNFGANAATAQAAWIAAANSFASAFTDNIHINITVDAVAGTSLFGMSNTPIFSISYGDLYNAALQDATSADDAASTGLGGSFGGSGTPDSVIDPIAGPHNWWVTRSAKSAEAICRRFDYRWNNHLRRRVRLYVFWCSPAGNL